MINVLIASLQIVFEAAVGASYDADIAIDDVVVTSGICPCKFKRKQGW